MRKILYSDKLKVLLLAGAVAVCIFGAVTGEAELVFRKAVNICMECIGLG